MIPVGKPLLGQEELDAAIAVLRSGNLVQGALVERFEQRFSEIIGVKHSVAVSTGTAALHIALLAHGVGPGDEVITTPFTFIATANCAVYAGARPVFVDICEDTFNLNPDLIEETITPRTKVLLPVHLYGHPADMAAIGEIAARHGLVVVEDAAQAHGAAIGNRAVGTFGTACFSFYATKNVTTAEGGMVTTDDDGIAARLRLLRSHGQRERYRHELLGYNYRLTDLQAAIGLVQLERLEDFTQRRIANGRYLDARLHNVVIPVVRPGYRHVYHQYTVRVPEHRDEVARSLNVAGIGTGIHYPLPVHKQPFYLDMGYGDDHLPVAERASREVLSLPVHPSLSEHDLEMVACWTSKLATSWKGQMAPLPEQSPGSALDASLLTPNRIR